MLTHTHTHTHTHTLTRPHALTPLTPTLKWIPPTHPHALSLISFTSKEQRKPRPLPLNTVAMLRVASSGLGLGPHHAMQLAERLYIAGYISYPRTESSKYPDHFDLHAVLSQQRDASQWGTLVRLLLAGGLNRPKAGVDAGDHPPITPSRLATPAELGGDSWRLYEYITRHFIATLSPDCVYEKTKACFQIGAETFMCGGTHVISPGWTTLLTHQMVHDEGIREPPSSQSAKVFELRNVALSEGKTSPPDYLTESELIGLVGGRAMVV
jgi:DNA topoisomerase III